VRTILCSLSRFCGVCGVPLCLAQIKPTYSGSSFVNQDLQWNRCRTCRKRKTRCDGKKPLCSTCTENGHECLGYAEVSEGITKKERKDSDAGPKKEHNEDDEGEEQEDKHMESARRVSIPGSRPIQRQYSNGSPTSRRTMSKDQSYFDSKPPKSRDASERERDTKPNFGDYRESAVFSEDGQSPLGNKSCLRLPRFTDEAVPDRSPPLQSESHRVPYFRYFGPTAIVPGFKQMVVSVREHRRSTGAGSSIASMCQ